MSDNGVHLTKTGEWEQLRRRTKDPQTLAYWLLDNNMVGVKGTSEVIAGLLLALEDDTEKAGRSGPDA